MSITVLLVGKLAPVVDDARRSLQMPEVDLLVATSLPEVEAAFKTRTIQHVIMGAGLELQQRLDTVRTIFQLSEVTTVHMKDFASGAQGYLPFVRAVLSGLRTQPQTSST